MSPPILLQMTVHYFCLLSCRFFATSLPLILSFFARLVCSLISHSFCHITHLFQHRQCFFCLYCFVHQSSVHYNCVLSQLPSIGRSYTEKKNVFTSSLLYFIVPVFSHVFSAFSSLSSVISSFSFLSRYSSPPSSVFPYSVCVPRTCSGNINQLLIVF